MTPAEMRVEYTLAGLHEADAGDDPIDLFGRWFHEALKADIPELTAMTLATVSPDGQPTGRIVLLKSFDHDGFTFYTNYQSRKSRDLAANPKAALVAHWISLQRQVRIEGVVSKVPTEMSDAYFASRPRGSKLGAWASPQSEVIADRSIIEQRLAELEDRFPGEEVPRPPNWGGYLLKPSMIEFWQGRPNRLHDRLRYSNPSSGTWKRERLGP